MIVLGQYIPCEIRSHMKIKIKENMTFRVPCNDASNANKMIIK